MNICTNNSTPKHSLSATNQATRELGDSQKFLQMRDSCSQCGSGNFLTGAGRKPGEMSLRCSECKAFIGYRDVKRLQRLRKQKRLTPCLQLLEKHGISGDAAIFILSSLGGEP